MPSTYLPIQALCSITRSLRSYVLIQCCSESRIRSRLKYEWIVLFSNALFCCVHKWCKMQIWPCSAGRQSATSVCISTCRASRFVVLPMSLTFRSSCIPPSLSICDLTNTSFGLELRYLQFNKLFKYILCISNVCSIQEICKVENAKQRKHPSVQSAHDLLFFLWVNQCIQLLHIPCTFFMLCS